MVPSSNQILHAMQHCAWHWMPRLRIDGCAHGSSVAWLVMPRFESIVARMAAALLGTWCLARISYCMQCSIAWHGMPRFRIDGCAHGSSMAWLVMPRFESGAARMASASLGTWCLARIRCRMQRSIAWHGMPRIRINGCTQGSGVAWLVMPRFASMAARMAAALGTWWVPRSNQLLHAMQHRLALDASHQNRWLRTGQRRCLARDASLRINGCTHGGSTWHMVGASLESVAACNAASLGTGCLASEPMAAHMAAALLRSNASFRIIGCTHGGSMSLGTWCLARISCCMQGSIAWHVMPRFESMAARVTAASPGIWCLARIRYCMQCSIAWHGMPRFKINGCAHGSSIAWLMMPRFASMAARTAAASLGTWCLA